MSDYDITHIRDWHRIKVRYIVGVNIPDLERDVELLQKHFVKKHVIMAERTEDFNWDYYEIAFKDKSQALLFKLICNKALYHE